MTAEQELAQKFILAARERMEAKLALRQKEQAAIVAERELKRQAKAAKVTPKELATAKELIADAQRRFREKHIAEQERLELERQYREMAAWQEAERKKRLQQVARLEKRDKDFLWVRSHIRRFLEKLGDKVEVQLKHPELLVNVNWEGGIVCRRIANGYVNEHGFKIKAEHLDGGDLFYYGEAMPYRHAGMIALLKGLPPWNTKYAEKVYPPTWVVRKYPEFKGILEELEKEDKQREGKWKLPWQK